MIARVLFATAAQCVARLAEAYHAGRLQAEFVRLGRYPFSDAARGSKFSRR